MKMQCIVGPLLAMVATHAFGQKPVTFPLLDGQGQVQADLYGHGDPGIVLAHGGRFN